jgi:hypothetical protein
MVLLIMVGYNKFMQDDEIVYLVDVNMLNILCFMHLTFLNYHIFELKLVE